MELDNYLRKFKLLYCIFNHNQNENLLDLLYFTFDFSNKNIWFILAYSILTDFSGKILNLILLNWKKYLIEIIILERYRLLIIDGAQSLLMKWQKAPREVVPPIEIRALWNQNLIRKICGNTASEDKPNSLYKNQEKI